MCPRDRPSTSVYGKESRGWGNVNYRGQTDAPASGQGVPGPCSPASGVRLPGRPRGPETALPHSASRGGRCRASARGHGAWDRGPSETRKDRASGSRPNGAGTTWPRWEDFAWKMVSGTRGISPWECATPRPCWSPAPPPRPPRVPQLRCTALQADNPSFPNPRRRLRLQDLADRVVDASEDEHELNQLLNEALLERESAQV